MVQHIFNSEYVTWKIIDGFSTVPYINNYPNLYNLPEHNPSIALWVNETIHYVDRESGRSDADLNMIMERLSEMLSNQELVFPIYSGVEFCGEYRYKYIHGVFVLVKHFDNLEV